jgi:hypothetical protein
MNIADRRRSIPAGIGDLAIFVLFPLLGSASHEDGLTAGVFLRTTVIFAAAWYAIAPWVGGFSLSTMNRPLRAWRYTGLAWLLAGSVALVARTIIFDRPLDGGFAWVVLLITGALLMAWRTVYAFRPEEDS